MQTAQNDDKQDIKENIKPVVLWIDDNPSLQQLAQRALTKTGFECVTAGSGEDAISMIEIIEPDIIMLDIEMPGMNGFETFAAIQTIRRIAGRGDVPTVMVSGHDDREYLDKAYNIGIKDIVLKPIEWKLLISRIWYILNDSGNSEIAQPELQQEM